MIFSWPKKMSFWGFFWRPKNPIIFHLILTKLFRYVCIWLGKSSTKFFYIYTYMWEKGAKSLIFLPRETLPLIFGVLQKFIYQNLAKDFRKLVQKSQIASYEKKNIFNSRRGGVYMAKSSGLDLPKYSQLLPHPGRTLGTNFLGVAKVLFFWYILFFTILKKLTTIAEMTNNMYSLKKAFPQWL